MRVPLALITLSILVGTPGEVAGAPADSEHHSPTLQIDLVDVRDAPETLQSLPASVTLANAGEISTYLNGNLEELEFLAPDLIVDSVGGTPAGAMISLRGIGSGAIESSSHPTVGLYLDGVPFATHTGRMLDLFDVDDVTVVRGAQGVFRGSNNLGGAILLRRTRPTGEFGGDVRFEEGSYYERSLRTRVNFPSFGDDIAIKLTFTKVIGGADYMRNCILDSTSGTTPGTRTYICRHGEDNGRDYLGGTATLLWAPQDHVSVQYTLQRETNQDAPRSLLNFSRADDLLCASSANGKYCGFASNPSVPQTISFDIVDHDFPNKSKLLGDYHTLNVTWNEGSHDLSVLLAARDQREKVYRDVDATSEQFLSTIRDQDLTQLNWTVRLASRAHERYRYLVGISGWRTEYDLDQETLYILDRLAAAGFDNGGAPAGASLFGRSSQKITSSSVIGHLNYRIDDQWRAELGGRFAYESADVAHQPGGTRIGDTLTLPDPIRKDSTWSDFSYLMGLTYQVDASSLLYFLASQGIESGGFDERAVSRFALSPYHPATATSYEVGIKTQRLADRMRVDVSAFQTKYRHKLETVPVVTASGTGELVTGNLAIADITGYEIELQWLPVENLQLRLAAARMMSKYDRFAVPSRNPDLHYDQVTDVYLPFAPKFTVSLLASYSWPFGKGRMKAAATYRYTADYTSGPGRIVAGYDETLGNGTTQYVPATALPLPIGRVHEHGLWNASISYSWERWTLRMTGKNLTNVRYLQNAEQLATDSLLPVQAGDTPHPLLTTSEYNQPRYVGFELGFTVD